MTALSDLLYIERLLLPVFPSRDVRKASLGKNIFTNGIAVVAAIGQHDEPIDLAENLFRALHVRFVAGHQFKIDKSSHAVSYSVELRVAPTLSLSKALPFRGLAEVTSILVDLDVSRVDDLKFVGLRCPNRRLNHRPKDTAFGPAIMEAVNAVPFTKALGKLIPLAPCNEDPPDTAQRFKKIARWTPFFTNVRFALAGVKLIFLRAQTARPASLSQNSSQQRQSAGIPCFFKDFERFHFVHTA
jgi:hypothetical protein